MWLQRSRFVRLCNVFLLFGRTCLMSMSLLWGFLTVSQPNLASVESALSSRLEHFSDNLSCYLHSCRFWASLSKKKKTFLERSQIFSETIKLRRKSVCVVSQFWLARIPKTSITIWQLKDWNGPRLRRLCLLHAVESQLFKKENVF